jgi:branched-chain amino acid transport system substrate-binding protein
LTDLSKINRLMIAQSLDSCVKNSEAAGMRPPGRIRRAAIRPVMGGSMKKARWTVVVLIAMAVVAALLIPVSASASSPRQAASGTIKVGSISPATNTAGGIALPQQKTTLEASIKAFNKRGGVMGKKLVLDFCDSKGDVNQEATCARQMVSDKVAATLDDFSVFNPDATAKILGDAGIPRIGINFSAVSEWKSPVSFGLSAGPIAYFVGMGQDLIKAGHKKLAEVIVQTPTAGSVKALLNPGFKALGGEIVTEVLIPPGTSDYSQYVAAATKDGADAALMLVDYPQAAPFMDAMSQLNSKLVLGISASSFTLDNWKKYSKYTTKAAISDATPNVTSSPKQFPGVKQFAADMKAGGFKLSELKGQASGAWLSVLAFQTVVDGAKPSTVDAASTLAALKAAKNVDLQGMIPPWTPSATDPSPIFTNVSNPYMYTQKFNGKTVQTLTPPINVMQILDANG